MLINGMNARHGIQNAASSALNKRQQPVPGVQAAAQGHDSPPKYSTRQQPTHRLRHDAYSPPVQVIPSYKQSYEESGQFYREAIQPKGLRAIDAYMEQESAEQKAEISRLMGIDVFA